MTEYARDARITGDNQEVVNAAAVDLWEAYKSKRMSLRHFAALGASLDGHEDDAVLELGQEIRMAERRREAAQYAESQ